MKLFESIDGLLEARDALGKVWRVAIITAGKSQNGPKYSPEVLKKALPLFENALAYTFELAKDSFGHLPDEVRNLKPKLIRNIAGWFNNIKYESFKTADGKQAEGVTANFNISDASDWLCKLLKDSWDMGVKGLLGFSIDGQGDMGANENVKSIDSISSVDVVTHPAAGGGLLRLVASVGDTKGGEMRMKEFIKWMMDIIRESEPDLVESLDPENVTDEQFLTLAVKFNEMIEPKMKEGLKEQDYPALGAIVSKLIALLKGDKKDEAIKVLTDLQAKMEKYPKPASAAGETAEEKATREEAERVKRELDAKTEKDRKEAEARAAAAGDTAVKAAASLKKTEELEEKAQMREAKALMLETLGASDLPEPVKSKIRKYFEGRLFETKELEEAIKDEKEMLAKLSDSGDVKGLGAGQVRITESEMEKKRKALDGLFEGEEVDKVTPFVTLREAFNKMTGCYDAGARDLLKACFGLPLTEMSGKRLTESVTTSTWAQALGDSITRKMVKEYNLPDLATWRLIVSDIVPIKDFRTNRRMLVGGYGNLPDVAEAGSFDALSSPTDDENTYAIVKKGGTEDLTIETIANDDVGVVRRIPTKLGRAAIQTLFRGVFQVFTLQSAVKAYDGTDVLSVAHGNQISSTLDGEGLTAGRIAMMKQLLYGSATEVLGGSNIPKYLVHTPELEEMAWKLATNRAYVQKGASNIPGEAATTENIHRGMIPILIPHWANTTRWGCVADPKNIPTMEVGFFEGKQEPELFVQDTPNVGTVFSHDKITYKIRHIWGIVNLDYRGMLVSRPA